MGIYNPARLEEIKYHILDIYTIDLQELQKDNIPTCFETHIEILRKALPYFPDEERANLQEILDAGYSQIQFLRASRIVSALINTRQSRKKVIDDFLAEVE